MSRLGHFTVLLVALALSSCEPAPGPPPAVSSATAPLTAPAAKEATEAKEAREREETIDAEEAPSRPGNSLCGNWGITTQETLAVHKYYDSQIAAARSPDPMLGLERELNLRQATPLVKVFPSHIEVHTLERSVVSREYDVLRETAHEVEIQIRGDGGERAVLTFSGENEIRAPGLVGLVGGAIWRRFRTSCVGRK